MYYNLEMKECVEKVKNVPIRVMSFNQFFF